MKNSKRKQFKSGIYTPTNYQKFGQLKCIYRSSYELQFLKWCDNHPKISSVLYEKIVIPYICKTDGKMHRYYIDCKIVMNEFHGSKTYLIEIKPFRQTIPPKPSKRKKQSTILEESFNYTKNTSKWDSAKQYCKKMGWRWCILTEKGIYIDERFYPSDSEKNILGLTKK